jgi:ketosteroid isomerase-like protein
MRRILGLTVALSVSCLIQGVVSLRAQQGKVEQEIMQIERDWCSATIKKDITMLGRILADDYTGVGSRGTAVTKVQELADLKSGDSNVTSCVDTNIKVRMYGDVAVVTGTGNRAGTYKGVAFKDRQILWTDVFVRKDERWQCVASQGTVVAAQQK